MGERTGIAYVHSTFSPWWGCTPTGVVCLNCYARTVAKRRGIEWGKGKPRVVVAASTWKQPVRWAKAAAKDGERRRVLVSMCDYLDAEAPADALARFYSLVRETAYGLDWLLLTKRSERLETVPGDVARVAWMGVSVSNQDDADARIPHLLRCPAKVRWLSIEPLLGPIDLWGARYALPRGGYGGACSWGEGIGWVVVGAESGPGARSCDPQWVRDILRDCKGTMWAYYKQGPGDSGEPFNLPHLDGRQWLEFPK